MNGEYRWTDVIPMAVKYQSYASNPLKLKLLAVQKPAVLARVDRI